MTKRGGSYEVGSGRKECLGLHLQSDALSGTACTLLLALPSQRKLHYREPGPLLPS